MLKYRPLDWVEECIEDHYRTVRLRAEGLEATAEVISQEASAKLSALTAERSRQQKRIRQLEAERTKLLHAHYADAVPLDLLQQEQARIAKELSSLQVSGQTPVSPAWTGSGRT